LATRERIRFSKIIFASPMAAWKTKVSTPWSFFKASSRFRSTPVDFNFGKFAPSGKTARISPSAPPLGAQQVHSRLVVTPRHVAMDEEVKRHFVKEVGDAVHDLLLHPL
jgi:hypothetical protein